MSEIVTRTINERPDQATLGFKGEALASLSLICLELRICTRLVKGVRGASSEKLIESDGFNSSLMNTYVCSKSNTSCP